MTERERYLIIAERELGLASRALERALELGEDDLEGVLPSVSTSASTVIEARRRERMRTREVGS